MTGLFTGIGLKRRLLSLAFAISANSACVDKEGLKSDICSYGSIEETSEERSGRLGDINCREVIPGHNNAFENRINIVFSGINYDEHKFNETVREVTGCNRENGGILSHQVISDNMDLFNFWYSNQIQNLYYDNGRYYLEESLEEMVSLTDVGRNAAQDCNGNNQKLNNIAPILFAAEMFRSHSGFPPMISHNIDNENYSRLLYLKKNLLERGIDELMCQDFSVSCHLLDINEDGNFTDEDLMYSRNYSLNEIQEMCITLHTPEECSQLNKHEILSDYNNATQHYGFSLCQILAEISTESTRYPSDDMCQVMLGEMPFLGSTVVSSRMSVPRTTVHEIGHSIATLRDEYVENGSINSERNVLESNGINCFIGTHRECMQNSNWSHLENTGCFEGCDYIRHGVYRSINNGIMRDSYAESFGAYNEERFCKIFKLLTGNAYGICQNYLKIE